MRTTRIGMIAVGVLAVAFAVAVPGVQVSILVLSGALVAWATYWLMTE